MAVDQYPYQIGPRLTRNQVATLLLKTYWHQPLCVFATIYAPIHLRNWEYLAVGATLLMCDGAYMSTLPALKRFSSNRVDDRLGTPTTDGGMYLTDDERRQRIEENWTIAVGFGLLAIGTIAGTALPLTLKLLVPFDH